MKVVLFYAETKSVAATQRRFRAHFGTRWAPYKQTICRLSLGTIFQPMRTNSVPDVKCFCNNKNVLCVQSMVWHFLHHPVCKGKVHPLTYHEDTRDSGKLCGFFNLGARWGWVVKPTPRPLYPQVRDTLHIVQMAGFALGPFWMGAENLTHTRIRTAERPARRQSLYRHAPLTSLGTN